MVQSKGEITIKNALDTILSGNGQKNHAEGIAQLKTIFQKTPNLKVFPHLFKSSHILTVRRDALTDKAYHSIFEALFNVARSEKRAYSNAKNPGQKTKIENVLTACSDALRTVIRAGAEKLKPKTVKAVIEHVTQLLPVVNTEYCFGLSQFYLKVLGTILEHEPHVEHLELTDWLSTADFCLRGIELYRSDGSGETVISSRNSSSSTTARSSSAQTSSTKLSLRALSDSSSASTITRKNSEELLQCLLYLISASNAPVHSRAEEIFQGIMHFLESHGSTVSSMHQVAFSALNIMLSSTSADKSLLSQSLAHRLVPIIGHFWLSKKSLAKDEMLNSAKDEMLITMLRLRLHLEGMVNSAQTIDFEKKLEELERAMRIEYAGRLYRDQLQLDDLTMATPGGESSASSLLQTGLLRIRSHAPRAERNWAILAVLSALDRLLYADHKRLGSNAKENDENNESPRHPRKRRRIEQRFDEITKRVASQVVGERLLAFQTLLYWLPASKLSSQDVNELLEQLVPAIGDRQSDTGSWAMICISSCAYKEAARRNSCSFDWIQLWHTVARLITSSVTCRAACYLLHSILGNGLVSYQEIAEDIDAIITTTEFSAPATLCDSSVSLMIHLLSMRNMEAPGGSSSVAHHVIRWASSKWDPVEKSFAARCAVDVHPIDILNLLRACLGLPILFIKPKENAPSGNIGQACVDDLSREDIIRYLLLIEASPTETISCPKCSTSFNLYETDRLSDVSAHGYATRRLILELFVPKFQSLLEEWESYNTDNSTQVSTDTLRCAASACVFGCLLLSMIIDLRVQQLQDQLEGMLSSLIALVLAQLHDAHQAHSLVSSILQAVQPYLPSITVTELAHLSQNNSKLMHFLASIANQLRLRNSLSDDVVDIVADDPMDLDLFDIQRSRPRGAEATKGISRRDLAVAFSPGAFYYSNLAHLILIFTISESETPVVAIPLGMIEYLISLRSEETLLSRSMIRDLLRSDLSTDASEASKLVVHVGEIIASSKYECCEVALGLCLDVLFGLVSAWADSSGGDLLEPATELYDWLINVVLPKRRPSPNVQIGLANLLGELMRIQPNFGEGREIPSVRSCLFDILQNGPIYVKFHIAKMLPNIFGFFILKCHDEILVDLLQSLPSDPDWEEGIAFRLKVLGALASRWPTLIRLCTYYILEVPGRLPYALKHAKRSLHVVSKSIGLKNARELFQLFASQLLYTWLGLEPIEKIPYEIFDYSTLRELLHDNQEEITALLTMRDRDDAITELAHLLELPVDQLLRQCFSKVMAYSIAHDISVPRSENAKKYVSGEARTRKRLGKEVFFELVSRHFADIIAIFFALVEQEEQIVEKSFQRDPTLLYAAEAMNEITSLSASKVSLPPNQQPAFKARYLTSEIDHLCGRTEFEVVNLYSPSMVVFIARRLLNTIHPALGSLHACSVLRKLRVLVALSGPAALQGYPLEMLLQGMRPFITDPECADDSMGLIQYLLARGSPYLSSSPSFVASISLTILASLRVFMESGPPSTTQQSQYRSTLSKAQSFHGWLGSWLAKYETSLLSGPSERSFRAILHCAHQFRSSGNADRGTPESELLVELLDDERCCRRLVNKSARNLAFFLLYDNFLPPTSYRSDILGSDDRAVAFAPTVWKLSRETAISGPFLTWAARILGRAFAATGQVHQNVLQESGLKQIMEIVNTTSQKSSKSCILRSLQLLTLGESRETAGIAEAVLRVIVTRPDLPINNLEEAFFQESLPETLYKASDWTPYHAPPSDLLMLHRVPLSDPYEADSIREPHWPRMLAISLVQSVPSEAILFSLQSVLQEAEGFAEEVFPFIVHLVLSIQLDGPQNAKRQLSKALRLWLLMDDVLDANHLRLLINTLLYLRTQPLPRENSSADRINWLEVDYGRAAEAAVRCGMFKTALLFIEVSVSETSRVSRRSSTSKPVESQDIFLSIFKQVDDPDIYYGLQQTASISTVLERLEYESDGLKSLAFRGAQYDNHLRRQDETSAADAQALVNALGMLNLDGLSHSLLQTQQTVSISANSITRMFQTARKLEQWDLPMPAIPGNDAATIYKTFQAVNLSENRPSLLRAIDDGLISTMSNLSHTVTSIGTIRASLQSLAALTEMDEIMSASNSEQFEEMLTRFSDRVSWMRTGKFDDVSHIMSCRETVLSCLSQQSHLRNIINVSASDSRLVEVQTTLLSSKLSRAHGALQESLTSATYLTSLIEPCKALGLHIEATVNLEAANALWEQGEMASSIGMLQTLDGSSALKNQTIPIGRSELLARIGSQVSTARLEKPDRIIEKYLMPAIKELKDKVDGNEAGQVFHEFAVFCDQQLQDPDGLEDLSRLKRLKEMKASEVQDLGKMVRAATTAEHRTKYNAHLVKAKQWLQLDSQEYRRLSASKDELLRQSLENYLLSLKASDEHDNDALRFSALWLEHSDEEIAMEAVSEHLENVPTRKFASLMNQLTSRLLDSSVKFQQLLFSLILRICLDHPYHGIYQIWAGINSKSNSKDETAVSRQSATNKVGQLIANDPKIAKVWLAINKTNQVYCQLAAERDESKYKAGREVQLKDSHAGSSLNSLLRRFFIPPPTLQVEVAPDLDYSKVPVMYKLEAQISIASGVSAPKIITVVASDGSRFKQLVKGGNDDLRQDAIMEQVFAQVSELLKSNTSTRQRNLGIRTYKVLPLSSNAGIIEFVSNTVPLHEFLMPAHERYYPRDLKGSQCRRRIGDVQTQKLEVRIRTYRTVTEQFHPVMRYFFMEKFCDPDEWFARRLAYTRSSAAISMLGHILGLGDRHGHNILLDKKTGEVVHIDLGVAFEMGRVLPVPELVPFRLTRDIVDGMGITKTEGVYRRCCEFTLEALRKESYGIMTILDVLRYDPLYSWSISPVRLAKLQDAQSAAPPLSATNDATSAVGKAREVVNEPSEADRALTVVKKKLSKTLSVTATVNDLINQASDERNLAVLYSGWAAYA